jgi:hypothetical protein
MVFPVVELVFTLLKGFGWSGKQSKVKVRYGRKTSDRFFVVSA